MASTNIESISCSSEKFNIIAKIVLILFLQKRRFSGLFAGTVGAVLCLVVYLLWVH